MPPDHRLPIQSYSPQRPCRFGLFAEWHHSEIEINCLWSAALGKLAKLLIDWQHAACSAESGACAVVQTSPPKQQYGERQVV